MDSFNISTLQIDGEIGEHNYVPKILENIEQYFKNTKESTITLHQIALSATKRLLIINSAELIQNPSFLIYDAKTKNVYTKVNIHEFDRFTKRFLYNRQKVGEFAAYQITTEELLQQANQNQLAQEFFQQILESAREERA